MQKECIFCQIVAGNVKASCVHEDKYTLAFMDQRQPKPGHVLVIPRHHVEMIYDLDAELAAHLSRTIIKVSRAIRSAFKSSDLNIYQSNGELAGQEIFHIHFHLFPRQRDDGYFQVYPTLPPLPKPKSELDVLASRIRKAIESSP